MNPIETVVMPLKKEAIKRAGIEAAKIIKHVRKELSEAGFDRNVIAPYPSGSSGDYFGKLAKYQLYQKLTELVKPGSYGMHEPLIVRVATKLARRYVQDAKENAAAQYDAFVAKLNKKIGEVSTARLEGNHVWSFSYLFIEKASGEKQIWKTQMIINQSKYGLLFNQFPTRKVKNAKNLHIYK